MQRDNYKHPPSSTGCVYVYNVRRLQTNPHNSVVKHKEHLFIYTRCDVTSAEVASHDYNYNTMTWQCLASLSLSAGSPTACCASFRSVKDQRTDWLFKAVFSPFPRVSVQDCSPTKVVTVLCHQSTKLPTAVHRVFFFFFFFFSFVTEPPGLHAATSCSTFL